eukprot:6435053-Prymnesium_polylepis.1
MVSLQSADGPTHGAAPRDEHAHRAGHVVAQIARMVVLHELHFAGQVGFHLLELGHSLNTVGQDVPELEL